MKPPIKIQLPGKIVLQGIPFKITGYDENGCPKTFEILPANTDRSTKGICFLYADEVWIRSKMKSSIEDVGDIVASAKP